MTSTVTCSTCTLRIAGLLERIDELERDLAATTAALALSNTKNAALRREMVDLRAEMAEVAEVVAAEVEAREPSPSSCVTTVSAPVQRRRPGRDTAQLPPETMASVIEGKL